MRTRPRRLQIHARTVAEARTYRRKVAAQRNPMALGGGARLEDIFEQVQRGEVATLNLVLKPLEAKEIVMVTDAAPLLQVDNANLASSFSSKQVDLLPAPGGLLRTQRRCQLRRVLGGLLVAEAPVDRIHERLQIQQDVGIGVGDGRDAGGRESFRDTP